MNYEWTGDNKSLWVLALKNKTKNTTVITRTGSIKNFINYYVEEKEK